MLFRSDNKAFNDYYHFPWIRVLNQDKYYLLELIGKFTTAISHQITTEGDDIDALRTKYHQLLYSDEELYWQDPELYWQKQRDELGFQDEKIGQELYEIVENIGRILDSNGYFYYDLYNDTIKRNISDMMPHDIELANKINDIISNVEQKMKGYNLTKDDDLTTEQQAFIKEKLEPLRQYLIDNYK